MVKLPYEVHYADFTIRVTAELCCFRWDILKGDESLKHAHECSVPFALSSAFDYLHSEIEAQEVA